MAGFFQRNLNMNKGNIVPEHEVHTDHYALLRQDIEQLRQELVLLKADRAALSGFARKAQRHNTVVIMGVGVATVAGWIMDGSNWLKWYLFPSTVLLCGLFALGVAIVTPYAHRRISQLEAVADNAEAELLALESGSP